MISELTLAMTRKIPLDAMAETVHCYPRQAEGFRRIALRYAGSRNGAAAVKEREASAAELSN